ncbi:nitroreductase family deazaflavin-dependent oxidoreductase [Dactylosporangium sp. NPDC049140]|uniref:nitroreductase family deazaflavin-dependent oxidoreductase n=1 Tax=Dactylosporangium sp. NPDC049140 TaxID=3155647 RepID=UPI0033D9508C
MPFSRVLTNVTRGRVNRIMLRSAGHAAFADLEPVGRRSGTVRHTPVRAFRVGDTVIVGLKFGPRSDWYKNITYAGTCRMRPGKEHLTLGAPYVVPVEQGTRDIPRLFRFGLRHLAHTKECAILPVPTRQQHTTT